MEPAVGPQGLVAGAELEGWVVDAVLTTAWQLQQSGDRLGRVISELPDESASRMAPALYALGLSVTAMFAAADIECNLAQPPKAVETRPRGPNHAMVTKCRHTPAHCWDGQGNYISCPPP